MAELGKFRNTEEIQDDFDTPEGGVYLVYGQIGNGKTTEATRRILSSLQNGRAVYTNIKLDLSPLNLDQRTLPTLTFFNLVFFRKRYYVFDKKNYHYVDVKKDFSKDILMKGETKKVFDLDKLIEYLNTLTDCDIHWDEGWYLLNSYEGSHTSMAKQQLIFHTRHFGRTITLYTQRFSSIHVSARSQINSFFKCEKLLSFPWVWLRVTEYQDLKDDAPDEEIPAHRVNYMSNRRFFKYFNTHELRDGAARSQIIHAVAYDLSLVERFVALFAAWLSPFFRKQGSTRPFPVVPLPPKRLKVKKSYPQVIHHELIRPQKLKVVSL